MKKFKPIMHIDPDSYDILVDNCCSQTIINNLQDYIKPPKLSDMRIRGFNENTTQTKLGTVRWRIHDDDGRINCIQLPKPTIHHMPKSYCYHLNIGLK
jgi:hypothetical protein